MLPPVSGGTMIVIMMIVIIVTALTIIFNPRVMRFWFLNVMTTDQPEEASCYCNCDGGRQEFWNADTGEIICNMTAAYGDEK